MSSTDVTSDDRLTCARALRIMSNGSHRLLREFITGCICDDSNALDEAGEMTVSTDRSSSNSVIPGTESSGINRILAMLDISDSLKGSSLMQLIDQISKYTSADERKKLAIRIKKWLLERGYVLTDAGPDGIGSVITKEQEG